MKTTNCKIVLIAIILTISSTGNGQDYKTALGLRLGAYQSGITVKHFVNPSGAIEGILGFSHSSFTITGLYEKHYPIANAPGLSWFFGGGAHLGFYRYGYYYYDGYYVHHHGHDYVYYYDTEHPGSVSLGLDFILGMEYKFQGAPVTLGLDVKPFVDFPEGGPWGYWDGALTARFTF